MSEVFPRRRTDTAVLDLDGPVAVELLDVAVSGEAQGVLRVVEGGGERQPEGGSGPSGATERKSDGAELTK